MKKKNYGECTGTCSVCTINLWGDKPVILPCNITGCPYEEAHKQNQRISGIYSLTGSGLAQI